MIVTQKVTDNVFGAKTLEELREQAEKAFAELSSPPKIIVSEDGVELEIEETQAGMTALVQLGNICLMQRKPEEAEHYYREAMEYDNENFIAITNVGAACMDRKQYDEAIGLFNRSIELNPYYLNAYYGLALAYLNKEEQQQAFAVCMEGLQKTMQVEGDAVVRNNMLKLMISLAENLLKKIDCPALIEHLKAECQAADGKEVLIAPDEEIEHSSILKTALAHANGAHEIKFQPRLPFTDYLVIRQLIRLQMVQHARAKGKNKVIEYTATNKANYNRRFGVFFSNLKTKMSQDRLNAFMEGIGEGFTYQLINFVMDLIVEDRIYFDYPELRPLQFLALTRQEQESLAAIRPSKELELMPQTIVFASRMMILVASLYFANLYGINIVNEYHGNEKEYRKVDELYTEFVDFLERDPAPGDEYELVVHFAQKLGFEDLITIHGESGLIL